MVSQEKEALFFPIKWHQRIVRQQSSAIGQGIGMAAEIVLALMIVHGECLAYQHTLTTKARHLKFER